MAEESKSDSNADAAAITAALKPNKTDLAPIDSAYKLNGKNYLIWSQLVLTRLEGKELDNHLTQSKPADTNEGEWKKVDANIRSWLWDSMDPSISITCMFLKTAKEIWEYIQRSYSTAKDAAFIYDLWLRSMTTKQEGLSVSEYATNLQRWWSELDQYQSIKWETTGDALLYQKATNQQRVYCFLAGLNPEYDQVRVQILGNKDLPNIEEVIATVKSEESRRSVMLENKTTESTAFTAKGEHNVGKTGRWCGHL